MLQKPKTTRIMEFSRIETIQKDSRLGLEGPLVRCVCQYSFIYICIMNWIAFLFSLFNSFLNISTCNNVIPFERIVEKK